MAIFPDKLVFDHLITAESVIEEWGTPQGTNKGIKFLLE